MSHSTKRFYGVLAAAVVMLAIVTAVVFFVRMRRDDSSDVYVSAGVAVTGSPEAVIRDILAHRPGDASLKTVTIDYPLGGSVFPPEMVSPTFLWHDGDNGTKTWLVDVAFESGGRRIYVLCDGKRDEEPEIDFNCVTETNVFRESEYQAAAKGWTPSERIWSMVKRHSVVGAEITIYGLDERRRIRSRGRVSISTSKDPVGALIFYRDVPLMPSSTKDGVIKPLKKSMWPLIKWRLRDISKPEAPVVMAHLPTCANCHTISRDGRTIAMDIDGPAGDKGAYAVKDISKRMVIEQKDVFTWNNFADKPRGTSTSGLFARISPDGRHVATMLNEKLFVANYTDYRFLQTFYPTRGIVVIYTRSTGEMKRLPGADDPQYVQGNPCWSPDGKTIVFIRARARDPYQAGPRPKQANDPRETPIRYDLYRIPFNDGKGGVAEPIPGASDNGMSNSYPR